jgi:hypothetical protein
LLFGLALPLRSLGGHKGAGNPFEYAHALHTKQRKDEKLLPQNIRYGASATWGDSQKRTEPLSLHIREKPLLSICFGGATPSPFSCAIAISAAVRFPPCIEGPGR